MHWGHRKSEEYQMVKTRHKEEQKKTRKRQKDAYKKGRMKSVIPRYNDKGKVIGYMNKKGEKMSFQEVNDSVEEEMRRGFRNTKVKALVGSALSVSFAVYANKENIKRGYYFVKNRIQRWR
jgi:hypothetical protein